MYRHLLFYCKYKITESDKFVGLLPKPLTDHGSLLTRMIQTNFINIEL